MRLPELRSAIEMLLGANSKSPVVVFAALWPFLRSLDLPQKEIPASMLQLILSVVGKNRSVLMPSFTSGYHDGVCDLDEEPSRTGVLSEMFRRLPGCERSLSAFFSFAILGPDAEVFSALQPEFAWGDESAYHWMEKNDASFLMLGTHPTHCSYLHRIEWLAKDVIPYRHVKTFSGKIIRHAREHAVTEKLFVRTLAPEAVNDFETIYDDLRNNGMRIVSVDGITVAHMTATDMKGAFLPRLLQDPLIVVKNRHDFEREEGVHDPKNN